MPNHPTFRRGLLSGLNIILILGLLLTPLNFSFVDKRGLFQQALASAAVVIPDNSLAYNFKLTSLKLIDGNQATVFDTQSGQVSLQSMLGALLDLQAALEQLTVESTGQSSFWLVKTADQVLTGATVRMQIPLLGFDKLATESAPGRYIVDISESMVLTPNFTVLSAQTVRNWQVEVIDLRLNDSLLQSTSLTSYVPDADWTSGGSHTIPLTFSVQAKIMDANGQPVTNQQVAAELSLPSYSYAETIALTTDSNGIATYQRTEQIIISVSGGQIQQLSMPVEIEGASAETVNILSSWQDDSTPVPPTPVPQTPTPQSGVCVSVSTSKPAYLVGEDVQIRGKVTDCRGAALPGASVSVTSTDPQGSMALSWSDTSDSDGNFTVGHRAEQPYGTYTAMANASNATGSDSASVSYEISSSMNVGINLTLSTGGADYPVTVLLTTPVTYNVYQRGNDTIKTDVILSANPPLSTPTDVQVVIELYKADKDGTLANYPTFSEQRTVTISTAPVTISPPVEFPLPGLLPVGYYKVRAAAFTAGGGSTIMGEVTADVAIIFNPPPDMAASFVDATDARHWRDGGPVTYDLQPRDGTVFRFALNAVDGLSDEASAAQALYRLAKFLVDWVQDPREDSNVPLGLGYCDVNNTSNAENENCVLEGKGQCFVYGSYLAAFSRAVGIPARPVSGGAYEEGVGAKDADEFAEASDATQNLTGILPKSDDYIEADFNAMDWVFHVWTEIYINGVWHVYDANQNYTDTQKGYGNIWIDDWITKVFNYNNIMGSYPPGGLIADKNGGGDESLDSAYLPASTSTPSPTSAITPTATPGPAGASITSVTAEEVTLGIENIVIQFDSPTTHLGQDIVFSVELTNITGETWNGDLGLDLYGSPIKNPASATALMPRPVWSRSDAVSVAPGTTLTRQYAVPYTDYQSVGTGEYFLNAQAQNATAQAWTTVVGAVTLDVQVPTTTQAGEAFTVTAVVSNPTDATVQDVRVTGAGLPSQTVGDLAPDASATLTWSFTPSASATGIYSISLTAETANRGMTVTSASTTLLTPPGLRLYQIDVPERVEVGQSFEIEAHLWNPGSDPVSDVTVKLDSNTPTLFTLTSPATVMVDMLAANSWTTITWTATAVQPGQLSAQVDASTASLHAQRGLAALVAEPEHAVDLVIDNVGDNTVQGEVVAEVPTGAGTNYAQAAYEVVVQNEGKRTDTLIVSVVPGDGGVAAFDDGETQTVQQTVVLDPGASTALSLGLRTWGDEATARVSVYSQGDRSQQDQMLVRLIRNDDQTLVVEPSQLDLTVQHGTSGSGVIQVSNSGSTPLTNVTLTPQGAIASWMQVQPSVIDPLAPGQEVSATLKVTVPKYQEPGMYSGSVRVQSGSQNDAVLVNVHVPESHAALVGVSPATRSVVPGNTGVYTVDVQNEGNVPDSYSLNLDGSPVSWEVSWSRTSVTLAPGARTSEDLLIIPLRSPDTKPAAHTFTVAASNSHTSASDQANLEALAFHEVDLTLDSTAATPGAPIIVTKVWKKAHEHPNGQLDVIILTHGAPTAADEIALIKYGATVKRRFALVNAIAATIPAAKLTEIANQPFVARIELDEEVIAVENPQANVDALDIDGLRADGFDGTGVVVAIVDTGIDMDHPALPNLTSGYDFVNNDADPDDDNGHGTHVAGVVGSNDPSAPGVAPNASLMPVKVLNAGGSGFSSDVIAGIEWAVSHGADEINLSLGTSSAGDGTSALSQSVDNAVKSGVVVVVAAGNNGPAYQTVGSPADARLDITVGALDTTTTVASFSSRGPTLDGRVEPDVLAPGVNIYSTWAGGGFQTKSGTSMAAPHLAGVVALLLDAYPITPGLVKEALTTTAVSLSGYDSNTQGQGRIDGDAASDYIQTKLSEASTLTLPGGTLVYTYTVTNLGNVDDSIKLTVVTEELPEHVLAYPPAIPVTWIQQSSSPVMLTSGEEAAYVVRIGVPANWAAMEAATYRFSLMATSQAEPEVGDTELAFLLVQPTKRSKIEYARLEIGWLIDEVTALPNPSGLLAKLNAADAKVGDALDGLLAGDLIRTETSLDTSINKMEAFVREAQAQRGKQIDIATADRLITAANAIISHLREARTTPVN